MPSCLKPANLDIILRTVTMAALVTLASRHHRLSRSPITRRAMRAAAGRRCSISRVMLPLWSSYLVKVYAWKLILAKEGILTWLAKRCISPGCSTPCSSLPVIGGNSLSCQLYRHLHRLRLCLAALHDPADAGGARARAGQSHRGLGRSRRRARPDLPQRDLPAGAARHRRRLDLHLLADARRLHHPADHRHLAALHRPGGLRAAGHGRQHPARRRLHRRADRHHGHLSLGAPSAWGRSMRSDREPRHAARPEASPAAAGLLFLHLPLR